jgi:DNA-binding NarL/FixJ family response regulator
MRPSPNEGPPARRHVTVVLVEDDAGVREQLVDVMRDVGIEVLAAVDGIALGYDAVVDKHPDVAVLDNRLADGTGTDLCRRLTAEFPALDVVMHAGVMTTAEIRAAQEAGATTVIQKSVRPDALIQAVLRSRHTASISPR